MARTATRSIAALILAFAFAGQGGCRSEREPAGEPAAAGSAATAATAPSPVTPAPSSGRPERTVLTAVGIKSIDPEHGPEAVDLMPEQLGKEVGRALTATELFDRRIEDVPPTHQAREARLDATISYDVIERGADAVLVCAVEAQLVWVDGLGGLEIKENVLAERPLSPRERIKLPPGLVADHAANALRLAASGIVAKEELRTASAESIVSALGADDPDAVAWALAIVGERRMTEAFDMVVAALDAKAADVRDAAIGALVALGDPRAVQPLAKLAEFSDHDRMRMVIEAVSAIGGRDAIEYLEFIASGHPDDDIKQRAEAGISRIQQNPRAASR